MSSRYGQWTLGDTGACNECGLVAWNTDIHDAFHNRTVDSAEPMQAPHYPEPEKRSSGESESLENWTAARAVALAENRALLAEAKALLADRDEAYETGYRDGLLSMFEPTDKGPFPRQVTLPDGTQATRHASLGATVEWAGIQRARKAIADMENAGGYPQSVFDHIKADALDCIDALEGEWAAGYKEAIADAVSRVEALDWDEIGLTIRHLVIAAIKGEGGE